MIKINWLDFIFFYILVQPLVEQPMEISRQGDSYLEAPP
jgi:hypothetical protein